MVSVGYSKILIWNFTIWKMGHTVVCSFCLTIEKSNWILDIKKRIHNNNNQLRNTYGVLRHCAKTYYLPSLYHLNILSGMSPWIQILL